MNTTQMTGNTLQKNVEPRDPVAQAIGDVLNGDPTPLVNLMLTVAGLVDALA